jgi:hypothetical protein
MSESIKMTKTIQEDVSRSKAEKKKLLKHEDAEEVCEENKCLELRRKKRRIEEEDK